MAVDRVYAKSGGVWRRGKALYIKVAGSWQRVKTVWVKVSGAWQQVYGEAVSITAFGTVVGTNSWSLNYSIFADTGNSVSGGGFGTTVTLEKDPFAIPVATYTNPGGAGNSASIADDETASYTIRLFDKRGVEVDSVTFTPS